MIDEKRNAIRHAVQQGFIAFMILLAGGLFSKLLRYMGWL